MQDMNEALDAKRNRFDEFDEAASAGIAKCLTQNKGSKLRIRAGIYPDGHERGGLPSLFGEIVDAEGEVLGVFNDSFPCPPLWPIE